MIHKEIHGTGKWRELFVYMNGSLLYKRWLSRGYGIVFNYPTHGV